MSSTEVSTEEVSAESVHLYEGMFLLKSSKYAADPEGVVNEILAILEKAGAQVDAHRPWQDGKLAYEMDGQRRGLHYLAYFKMPGAGAKSVQRSCKLSDTVIRYMLINQPQSLYDVMMNALSASEAPATEQSAAAPVADKKPAEEKPAEEKPADEKPAEESAEGNAEAKTEGSKTEGSAEGES